jgi:hypothetical protein
VDTEAVDGARGGAARAGGIGACRRRTASLGSATAKAVAQARRGGFAARFDDALSHPRETPGRRVGGWPDVTGGAREHGAARGCLSARSVTIASVMPFAQ